MEFPTLYIAVGLPGSGKSTFFRNHKFENTVYVSRDLIRYDLLADDEEYFAHENVVFKTFVNALSFALKSGQNAIADATHLTRKSRAKLINAINQDITLYSIVFIYFDTEYTECIDRNEHRSGRAYVPEKVIENMNDSLEIPQFSEFSNCYNIITVTNARR